ncbi:probable pectinesterase 53 [Punica granatum]|uniref:Pectinesterase n=2 Tax=Punica granatum TaxID=22663 RepID=A0A218W284_PUNGR|nr:probable pectinesterase 53 [Punica granatum]OWM66420.1 hypothetical protein CDL15_Pgr013637 [Punica granatum]PKI69977.1 hypothetical protein CRG98_009580 [Punica granatum]
MGVASPPRVTLAAILTSLLVLALLLGVESSSSFGPNGSNGLVSIEKDYAKWLRQVGSFRHSLTKNRESCTNKKKVPEACLIVRVSKRKQSGAFQSVQKAISSVPTINNCRVVIFVGPGTYREKVEIPATMAYVTLKGSGADRTIIEWDDTADRKGPNGRPLGTYASATFAVNSPHFIAKNITFKNNAPLPPSGALGKQAVAFRISADKAAFKSCRFIGAQDTLYDHTGRHYFENCYIEGSVDFVFGDGLSLYRNCHLHAVTNSYGALTAQKRESLLDETGFSFVECRVTGSGALYLGRAWGTFSRVVFAYTYMDKIITPRGWYDWGDKNREMTVFFGQYKCLGPGAAYEARVPWSRELTSEEAEPFISLDFIDGNEWLPKS